MALTKQNLNRKKEKQSKRGCLVLFLIYLTYYLINSYEKSSEGSGFFERQNENGGMNLQKNQESTKEHNSKSQKLTFGMISVSCCLNKFSNIGSIMHCCQMSKADAGHVDFLTQTNLI
jgi:hypothetical protein